MRSLRAALAWGALGLAVALPLGVAAASPLLAWRQPVYVAAGFAGIVAMALLLVQPLLVAGVLPGLPRPLGRRVHPWIGSALVLAVAVHVAGLWITSPPDMVDALLLRAPTAFSFLGVAAMWALVAAAVLAALRRRGGIRPSAWRFAHSAAVAVAVAASVAHAVLIEGTMGTLSKWALCLLAVAATGWAIARLRPWAGLARRRT